MLSITSGCASNSSLSTSRAYCDVSSAIVSVIFPLLQRPAKPLRVQKGTQKKTRVETPCKSPSHNMQHSRDREDRPLLSLIAPALPAWTSMPGQPVSRPADSEQCMAAGRQRVRPLALIACPLLLITGHWPTHSSHNSSHTAASRAQPTFACCSVHGQIAPRPTPYWLPGYWLDSWRAGCMAGWHCLLPAGTSTPLCLQRFAGLTATTPSLPLPIWTV
jgi:hypothetical protein